MEEEKRENNEIAVIFNRIKSEFELVEEFVPVRIVEGYYYEPDECFVDSKQNVYSHIASIAEVGNVYGGRKSIAELARFNKKLTLSEAKQKLLNGLQKYRFFKNIDEAAADYCVIKAKNKKTGELSVFCDAETEIYYAMYREFYNHKNIPGERIEDEKLEIQEETKETKLTMSPSEIIEKIKRTIKGQDEAIETIVTLLWVKYNFPEIDKTNMLIVGPSGVGKTAIFKKIKQILDIPVSIFAITGVSQAGYVGHDIEEMLSQLYFDSGKDVKKAEHGIIIVDEIDKIANNRDSGEIGTVAVQNELLKLIEGCERNVSIGNHQTVTMDTTNIIFVCCGAFSDLYTVKKDKVVGFNTPTESVETGGKITTEKIIKYGIARELAGRLPVIIELNDLNENKAVLKDILLNSDESQLSRIIEAIKSRGITIENIDETIDNMVEAAIFQKIGVRGLVTSVMRTFLKIFKEIGNNPDKYESIIIGPNIVIDNNDFKLIPKDIKKKVRKEGEI